MNEARQIVVEAERVQKPSRQVASIGDATPLELLRIAVSQGADLEKIEKLMALQERFEANQARKAYTAAMAEFKAKPIQILKDTHVSFTNRAGTLTQYDHASLSSVCDAIIAGLSEVGISHRWVPEQVSNKVKVTCVLTHRDGHSESTCLESAPDDSGGKNSIQAIASATTYLSRYTLLMATGLATKEDDDGRGAADVTFITENQVADLKALGSEVGVDKERFLRTLKIDALEHIPAAAYSMVVALLEARRARPAAMDTAHKMRQIMSADLAEEAIAKNVSEENERLNREAQELLSEAWKILNSAERTSWTGWVNYGKKNGRK